MNNGHVFPKAQNIARVLLPTVVPQNHFTSGLQVPSTSWSQSRPPNFNRPPFSAYLTVEHVLAYLLKFDQELTLINSFLEKAILPSATSGILTGTLAHNFIMSGLMQWMRIWSNHSMENQRMRRRRRTSTLCLYQAHQWPMSQGLSWMTCSLRTWTENWRDTLVNTWKQR